MKLKASAFGRNAATLALIFVAAGCTQADHGTPAAVPAAALCDLNATPCPADTAWGKMVLTLSPRPVPVLRPVSVEARFERPNKVSASLALDGVEMDMGPNTTRLSVAADHAAADAAANTTANAASSTRRGELLIPVCITGSMRWRLTVQLTDGERNDTVRFEFTAPTAASQPIPASH